MNTITTVDVNTDNLDDFTNLLNGNAVEATDETNEESLAETNDDPGANDDTDELDTDTPEESDSEPDDDESKATDEVDEDGEAEQTDDEEELDLFKPKPKKKSVQDRIDELTRNFREAERRAEELARKLEERDRVTETKTTQTPPTSVATGAPNPDAKDDKGELIYPLGEFDPAYIRDMTKHTIEFETKRIKEQNDAALAEAEQMRAQEELNTAWNAKLAETEKDFPDLRSTIASLEEPLSSIDPTVGQHLADTIMQMDNGAAVLYYLGQNPDEAVRIATSGLTKATLELGRLEARVESALARKRNASKVRTTKIVTPPPTPTRGTGTRNSIPDDTDDLDAFASKLFRKR